MQDDEFEWDDDKDASNIRDHKIPFELARHVFTYAFALEREDRRENYGEARYTITGMVAGRLFVVAYTLRAQRIRIISARPAEPFERRHYHETNRQD